ncbi:protein-disulfide isomerase [Loktanella ponticola]|uniref:Protein-disulfide isomerase n=1 Tax=Yoonia ponticola TaxID=1524255 RepID=A0A7W9BHB8_9RHOB|nr:DsbA family protein [Yoonia ponticola]MBB5720456.1 protein-disulfide isomerase [Yoonia ponticola]
MKRRDLLKTGSAAVALSGGFGTLAHAQEETTIEITDMVLGDENAPIEMIEYASFTCPHCAAFHANVYPKLKADYIDTGKVKFIYREVYFDRFGLWASMIARCAGQERFFGLSNLIYENQRDWAASGDPAIVIEELRKLAKTTGLNDAALDACMSDADQAEALVGWYQTNAERDEVNSTPSFLIDGEKFGNMSYDAFQEILDAKLA